MSRKILWAAALLALSTGGVVAADYPIEPAPVIAPPVVVPVYTWTGCYIGGNGGGASASTSSCDTNGFVTGLAGAPVANAQLGSQTITAGIGGVQLGCDYQKGMFVLGIQGMFDVASSSSDLDFAGGILVGTQKISGFGSVTARVGVAPLPAVLLYVKGGAAWISESYDLALTPTGAALILGDPTQAGPAGNASFSKSGWTAGGGVEWAFLNNASVFAEYEHLDFGTVTANFTPISTLFVNPFSIGVTNTVNVFRIGINARIGPSTFQ